MEGNELINNLQNGITEAQNYACPQCGTAVLPEQAFCPDCGCNLKAVQNTVMQTEGAVPVQEEGAVPVQEEGTDACPRCGMAIVPEQMFCPVCGCNIQAERENNKRKAERKKKTKKIIMLCGIGVAALAVILTLALYVFPEFILPAIRLSKAKSALSEGEYSAAVEYFKKSGRVSKGEDDYTAYQYALGMEAFEEKDYVAAADYFAAAGDYPDADAQLLNCGDQLISEESYTDASYVFSLSSSEPAKDGKLYADALDAYVSGEYTSALEYLSKITGDTYDVDAISEKVSYEYGMKLFDQEEYSNAKKYFLKAGDYEDAKTYATGCDVMDAEYQLQNEGLSAGTKAFDALAPSLSFNGISVSKRQETLHSLSDFAVFEGKYTANWNYIETRNTTKYGSWNSWYYDTVISGQDVEITVFLNNDGTVDIKGEVCFYRFTNYSTWQSYLKEEYKTKSFHVSNVSSIPQSISIDANTVLTYSKGTFKLEYSEDADFSTYSHDTYSSSVTFTK